MKRILVVCLLVASPAFAAENLKEVISDPVEAPGMTAVQIADRAMQCIKSASDNVADKVDPARDGDTAYAIVYTGYKTGLGAKSMARGRLSVVAKDGRFKVISSEIEQPNTFAGGWMPIYGHAGGGAKQARIALQARAQGVADCITKPAPVPGGDDW